MNVALVGCGNIAERYAKRIGEEQSLTLVGVVDTLHERADALARACGVRRYDSLEQLLSDDAVELVANLTPALEHARITAAALEAGKHVHTEKPVALDHAEAQRLAELADEHGVRLSCAPATLLGEAQQTAWKLLRDGFAGTIRAVYAEANWGRIEAWHPTPQTLYSVGALVDVGIYPLTILTAIFGAARRATAYATTLQPERTTIRGEPFTLDAPDFVVALIEFDGGVVARLTATFWVGPGKQRGIEFHGDARSLYLASWAEFDSRLESSEDGEAYAPVPLLREPYHGIDWARPLVDLAAAVAAGRPHRASAEHAAHVVEVVEAIRTSSERNAPVEIRSACPQLAPMEWAL